VDRFTESEANLLYYLVSEFSYVIALDDSELGCTDRSPTKQKINNAQQVQKI